MTALEITAQVIGILAMTMNVLSFQFKEQKKLILVQLAGAVLFTAHFLLLCLAEEQFLMGFALNVLGMARAYVYSHKEQFHAEHIGYVFGFVTLYLAAYILTFTVFGMEATAGNLIIELLPVIGMTITTVSFRMKDAKSVRRLGLINSPAWLAYNVARTSIGGAISEVFCLVSVVVGILRLDRKKAA